MSAKETGSEGDSLRHRPLAGLAALRSGLPDGPAAESDDTPPEEATPPADDSSLGAKLVVQRERKKRRGKTVTRIRGLEVEDETRAGLAKELAKALGCGASVEDGDIVLQGDQTERAADWLERKKGARVVRGN